MIDHKEPCETCVRWDECNGVDENCPLRKDADTYDPEME